MSKTYGSILKDARIRKHFSLQELAELLENRVTRQALSLYEHDKMRPSADVELKLCKALDIGFYDLYVKPAESSDTTVKPIILYRTGVPLSKKFTEWLDGLVSLRVSEYRTLCDRLSLRPEFPLRNLNLPNLPAFSVAATEAKEAVHLRVRQAALSGAYAIRKFFGFDVTDPILSAVNTVEHTGIVLLTANENKFDGKAAFPGTSGICGDVPFIILPTATTNLDARVIVLREFAYRLLQCAGVEDSGDENITRRKLINDYCNSFAHFFLFTPEALEKEFILPSFSPHRNSLESHEVAYACERFGITFSELKKACLETGLISHYAYNEMRDMTSPDDYPFSEKPSYFLKYMDYAFTDANTDYPEEISMPRPDGSDISGLE